jgi:hypothetical protein
MRVIVPSPGERIPASCPPATPTARVLDSHPFQLFAIRAANNCARIANRTSASTGGVAMYTELDGKK